MKAPLKVLIVTTGYPRFHGDVFGVFVQDYCKALRQSGIEVSVLAPHEKGLPYHRIEEEVSVYRLPYFFFKEQVAYGSGIPTNIKRLGCKFQLPFFVCFMTFWTFLLSFKFHIVHAQWSISGLFAILSKWCLRKNLVVTYRGSDLNSRGVLKKITQFVSRNSDLNCCVSEAQQELLKPQKSFLCPNVIDTTRFKSLEHENKLDLKVEMGFHKDDFILIYVGTLIPTKRPFFIVDLMKDLDVSIKLLILGDGELKDKLEQKVQADNLQSRVLIKGHVDNHQIHKFFQISDLHIMASENEGRPNVIYQAMSCKVPTIATSVGGIPEMILHEESGYLLELNSSLYLEKIGELKVNHEKRARFGEQAFLRLKSFNNDFESVAQHHLNLYQSIN